MSWRERIAFLGQMRADFEHTGAVQPSSRYLADAMAAPLVRRRTEAPDRPLRILEIGPGTGAVTRVIATAMGPRDELVCYEINPEFARLLADGLREDPRLSPVADRTVIHAAPAQQLEPGDGFDFALCSAPLNNFEAGTIDAILGAMIGALRPTGRATLFEYLWFPALRRMLVRGEAARRLRDAEETKRRWLQLHARDASTVLRNIPPATVHELGR